MIFGRKFSVFLHILISLSLEYEFRFHLGQFR